MAGKGGTGQACAACKFQRRKCAPECPLAPYFPPDKQRQFLNAHRLFGVSNILRILKQVDDSKKGDAMKSIIYQAEIRAQRPVHGCLGVARELERQVHILSQQLDITKSQLSLYQQLYQNNNTTTTNNYSIVPLQKALCQPTNSNNNNLAYGASSHALPPQWMSPAYFNTSPYSMTTEGTPIDAYEASNNAFYRNVIDTKPPKLLLEYETRNPYDPKEAYESSAESSIKEAHSIDHLGDREGLRNAAAQFTLTNQN